MTKRMTPLDRAAAIAGSWTKLAGYIGVTPQAVSQWKRVPPSRVLAVERATGVSRHDLRPDLYPREEPAPIRSEQAA